ncbi:MAG: undecaprenyl-phosphate glucose phosphotransferase [Bacteroidales bacterium]|nr:undecaprenyl-phosphate glucose phosphotransferase [Bacteroidales bacterium]
MKFQSQVPALLKFSVYLSELATVSLLFYAFFYEDLNPAERPLNHMSPIFGWMVMALMLSYIVGVWVRPIAYFYRSSRRGTISGNVLVSVVVTVLLFVSFLVIFDKRGYFSEGVHQFGPIRINVSMLVPYFLCLTVALILQRYLLRWLLWTLRSAGRNRQYVVLVGFSDNILELWSEMQNKIYGYYIVGYFNDVPVENFQGKMEYLGTIEDIHPYLHSHLIHQLYCALPSSMAKQIVPIINTCEHTCCHFYSVPNVRNYLKRTMTMEILGSVPVLTVRNDQLSGSLTNRFLKRTFDIIVSSLFLLTCFWWIYLIVALLCQIFQPGPVFFFQRRSGLGGKEFVCIKFRSMKVNSQSDELQATEDDPRKTRFGDFLRRYNIDELPQFINVFKGDMSIVGPRPHMVKHTEEYSALIDKYMVRHWVRPGITGWAQVTGSRGETRELWQMEQRIKKDIWYIENWSLFLDLQICFMTVVNMLVGDKNAY